MFVLLSACDNKSTKENNLSDNGVMNDSINIGYDFSTPQIMELDKRLQEISGLSCTNGHLYTHNDEEGVLVTLNIENGEIISAEKFGKSDDYEGVEVLDGNAYLINSSGLLSIYNLKNQTTEKIKTPFDEANNVEGLCFYTPNINELLIACKGKTLHGKANDTSKEIYRYHLKTQQLDKKPFVKITPHHLVGYFKTKYTDLSKHQRKQLKHRLTSFAPSGIAIHPSTQQLFIVSARGSLLLILNAEKEIEDLIFLDEKKLPQPEGICFDTDNNLYISSEGKGGEGRILKYLSRSSKR